MGKNTVVNTPSVAGLMASPEMNEVEVIALMVSSQTEKEWDANCAKVKKAFNGYPNFWYPSIVSSGVASRRSVYFEFGSIIPEPE